MISVKLQFYQDGFIEKEITEILLFLDLRDHYGITQCVIENNNKYFKLLESVKPESVIRIKGKVAKRSKQKLKIWNSKLER